MRFYLSALVIIFGLLLAACNDKDNSTSPEAEHYALVVILMDSVVVDSFYVTEYNDGDVLPVYNGGTQLGEVEINVFNNPMLSEEYQPEFNVIARKDGCYSCFKDAYNAGEMQIDYISDFEAYNPDVNCGVIFAVDSLSENYYEPLPNNIILVWEDGTSVGTLTLGSDGRFETTIPAGDYTITWNGEGFSFSEMPFQLKAGYAEYVIPTNGLYVYKPNIYLYPQAPITLDVNIAFPQGGRVTVSEPQFPQQWQGIHVEPNGTINGRYGYLFYECTVPDFAQRSAGWVVARDNLEAFFTRNLSETGFVGREITDFTDWWIPRLNTADWYAIYPQYAAQLDPVISLEFSQQPDNILRLTYCVQPLDTPNLTLAEPQIPAFERTGFVATEWGVIRLPDARKPIASR